MPPKTYEDENVTDDESDVELDNEGVVESDDEPPQKASRLCSHLYSNDHIYENARFLLHMIVRSYLSGWGVSFEQ